MEFTAKDIAGLVGGTIDGNPDVKVNRLARIDHKKRVRNRKHPGEDKRDIRPAAERPAEEGAAEGTEQ